MNTREPFVFEETCVPRRVLELFSVKWTSMVLYALQCGTTRTGELQRRLPGISKKMLTQTLRELERDGLIHREVYAVVPPKVEYSLTPLGELFIEPIEMLYRWGNQHADVLAQLSLRRGKPTQKGTVGANDNIDNIDESEDSDDDIPPGNA
ncbi:winged helix-turn-helix transcriptional regulator [Pandoraea anhela]|uniref:HxlR family transcriptional regulator n=1 Tax=Pandoraea anhela TaxID=2508295 RepID=A0A5E4Y1R0_9BURK|nr:helix-turn-helix domain-containing protein [Pandoraea anhela]VVE42423.1 HxlR family transcriptional regulator [Pandoraea anhela]